ncbi:MAG TPA: tetratricopeptide repeat protein, partial [Candidatus Wujingus californicus]
MLFTRTYRSIFLFVIVLSACLSGCTTVTSKYCIKSVSGNKERISYLHESAYTYFCAGYFSMLSKDWQSAIDNFEKASLIDRNSERILQHLATCYYQAGNIEKSINCIEKLVKIKPDEFNIHYTLATLYESLGKRHESIMEYERARKCRTDNLDKVFLADTLYRLANLYMDEELMEKGAECYKSMFDMKLVSDPAKIYYEIGQRYFEKNDIKKALEYF